MIRRVVGRKGIKGLVYLDDILQPETATSCVAGDGYTGVSMSASAACERRVS